MRDGAMNPLPAPVKHTNTSAGTEQRKGTGGSCRMSEGCDLRMERMYDVIVSPFSSESQGVRTEAGLSVPTNIRDSGEALSRKERGDSENDE